jgi:hypothetical protein
LGALLPGCQLARYVAYLFGPGEAAQTVEAEYTGLSGRRVALVIYADEAVLFEYPRAQLELSLLIGDQLRKNVKGIFVVAPEAVLKYQADNVNWDTMDKTRLAKALGADHVLQVSLVEFASRERGMVNVYRGRIVAEAAVYQATLSERQSRVWRCPDLRVSYPEQGPAGEIGTDDVKVRYATEALFADRLAKKFYRHQVKKKT